VAVEGEALGEQFPVGDLTVALRGGVEELERRVAHPLVEIDVHGPAFCSRPVLLALRWPAGLDGDPDGGDLGRSMMPGQLAHGRADRPSACPGANPFRSADAHLAVASPLTSS
jgi:hypothetical protein